MLVVICHRYALRYKRKGAVRFLVVTRIHKYATEVDEAKVIVLMQLHSTRVYKALWPDIVVNACKAEIIFFGELRYLFLVGKTFVNMGVTIMVQVGGQMLFNLLMSMHLNCVYPYERTYSYMYFWRFFWKSTGCIVRKPVGTLRIQY